MPLKNTQWKLLVYENQTEYSDCRSCPQSLSLNEKRPKFPMGTCQLEGNRSMPKPTKVKPQAVCGSTLKGSVDLYRPLSEGSFRAIRPRGLRAGKRCVRIDTITATTNRPSRHTSPLLTERTCATQGAVLSHGCFFSSTVLKVWNRVDCQRSEKKIQNAQEINVQIFEEVLFFQLRTT